MSLAQCRSALLALCTVLLAGCASRDASTPAPAATGATRVARTCDAYRFGAIGDGQAKDTAALQRAVDDCSTGEGGSVVLARGTFLSGTLVLHSHVTLRIEAGATLLGSRDDADYPTQSPPVRNTELANCQRALVYAEGATAVRIEGSGTIWSTSRCGTWSSAASRSIRRTGRRTTASTWSTAATC